MHWLKAAQIKHLKPGWHADGGGLYLFVSGTGGGSWIYRYAGKNHGLGSVNTHSLVEARELARECRQLRQRGIDPRAHREAERVKGITFDQAAAAYIAAHEPAWRNSKHREQWRNTLATYCSPVIGAVPVGDINIGLVLKILEPIWPVKPETAGRVRGRIEMILDWAAARGYRDQNLANPAQWKGRLDKLLPKRSKIRKVRHHPALPHAKLPAFMASLKTRAGVAVQAIQFLVLTAARSGEVRGATFAEFDLDAKVWTVPGERMKADRPHRVPLSEPALAIIAERKKEAEALGVEIADAYVFPGMQWGKSLSDMTLTATLRRMDLEVVPHGFRATFKTWATEETNFPRETAEAALAHVLGDKTEAAYSRGDLFDKRRDLMNAWAEYADSVPDNVVPIKRRRA